MQYILTDAEYNELKDKPNSHKEMMQIIDILYAINNIEKHHRLGVFDRFTNALVENQQDGKVESTIEMFSKALKINDYDEGAYTQSFSSDKQG